jgi:hypothetical protein
MCKNENDRSKIIEHFSKYISQSLAQYNELVKFAKDQRVANLWNNISSNVTQDICGLTASINEGTLDLERKHHSRGYPNTTTSSSFLRSHQSHFSGPEKGPKSSGKLDHFTSDCDVEIDNWEDEADRQSGLASNPSIISSTDIYNNNEAPDFTCHFSTIMSTTTTLSSLQSQQPQLTPQSLQGQIDEMRSMLLSQEEKFNTVKTFFQKNKTEKKDEKVTFEFNKSEFDEFEKNNCSTQ